MYTVSFKEYCRLFKKVVSDVILRYRFITIFSMISAVCVLISTYYFTKIAEASSELLDKSSAVVFSTRLKKFVKCTTMSLVFKYVPLSIFTFFIQLISREQFIENVKKYMSLPYTKFHMKTPGEMRFTIFLKSLSYPLCAQIVVFDFVGLIGTTLFTFIKAYSDINLYAAAIFAIFPVFYLCANLIFLKYKIIYHTKNLEQQQKTSARIYDKLSNYDVIKSYNKESYEIDSFRQSLKKQVECQLNSDIFTAKGRYVIRFVLILPYVILGLFTFIYPDTMNGKTLLQATLLYSSLSGQIKKLGVQMGRLANLLNQIKFDEIEDQNNAEMTDTKDSFERDIELRNVSLFYGDKLISENINLKINKGEKVAIIGKNGTGKSTFIKAILRFTKYTGDILIDGKNIKNLTNKSLFNLISYIPQDDFTSDDTVLNNIKLGNKNATRDQVIRKAKFFKLHDMFSELPDGYDYQAGIKGNKLSGGQKQKLSILRAAVKDAPIFIFDEATAAIDKEYESIALDILLNKMKQKTMMMIIHNKNYLKMFDKIVLLDQGQLGSFGSYEELEKTSPLFREFISE